MSDLSDHPRGPGGISYSAFLSGLFAWTFDAFDFFILTYVLAPVAIEFHQPIPNIALTLTASLVMRPVGAFLFGLMADRYGRRLPLMIDVIFYSAMEILSGLAPSYRIFLALRLLYGVGMGGAWGVGASLAMESVPTKRRGILSGVLQEGYAFGNLLAAIGFWTVFPRWGWRPLFFLGVVPALFTLFLLARAEESDAWKSTAAGRRSWAGYFRMVAANWRRFLFLVALMAMMNFISHGTQDMYPTFLQQQRHLNTKMTALISVASMIGAIAGGILIGLYSDRRGRRRAMVWAVLVGILLIPLWVFAPGVAWITAGAFLMQFLVQGAWGVVPVHINELSPDAARGFFPGFAYQWGVVMAASAPYIEAVMSRRLGYAWSMAVFAAAVLAIGAIVIGAGPEAHRIPFGRQAG
jgi:MFS transporter, SHS family, lactate transporter